MYSHTHKLVKLIFGAAVISMSSAAMAAYPEKPIKLIVPFPAGGLADTVARIVAERLTTSIGQPVIVDYKAGAATILGANYTAQASNDGYTLLLGSATTFAVNPIIYSKLSYEPLKDFEPIGIVGSSALALVANPNVSANNVTDLIAEIKAEPDTFSYGSHGSGSTVHFAAEMLWNAADVEVLHVPYKGSAPAMVDLMGGQIKLAFDSVPAAMSAAKGGRIKVLATTGKQRGTLSPDVPTISESGFPVALESWWAVVAPKGISQDVQTVLVKGLAETMADSAVQQKLNALGFEARYAAPEKFSELIKQDTENLTPIAKANNIRQD